MSYLGYLCAAASALIFSKQAPDILWGIGRCLAKLGALRDTVSGTTRRAIAPKGKPTRRLRRLPRGCPPADRSARPKAWSPVKRYVYALIEGGEVVLGSKKVPIVKTVTLQAGYTEADESAGGDSDARGV